MTISESWLDESDVNISIPRFQPIFHDDLKGDAHGGGVAIFCGENVNSELCGELTSSELPPDCSNIWLKLYFENSTKLLGTYYRPPGQSAQNRDLFLNCLSYVYSLTKAFELNATTVLITGDFNDRCTEWHSDHSASDLRLYNLAERYGLLQLVKYPTRITDTTSSLLDLILTDSSDLVEKVSILPPISTSDHSVVCCRIKLPITNFVPNRRTVWNCRNADFASLNNSLQQAPFDSGYDLFDDPEDVVSYWVKLYKSTVANFIPHSTVSIRPTDKPWINGEFKRLIRKRNRLWKRFKRSNDPVHYQQYKKIRNAVVSLNRKNILAYHNRIED